MEFNHCPNNYNIIISKIKDGLKRYTYTIYSRNSVNQIWILQNSKELLEHLISKVLSKISAIKTFELYTLYTTIPHRQLKYRLSDLVRSTFICKNGSRRYKYVVVKYNTAYLLRMKVSLQINIQRPILFEWLKFVLITYMRNLVIISISRLLVFKWVLIMMPHWLQTFSYIHMKLILYNIYKIVSSRNKTKIL